ncbi:MAG TPA: tetratricopeptide repeat protein [Pyrinomonadaceae bacterium]|nr:tetratricopeptide repeat protein [Pyrinomonadaceae bacterium]
MKRISLVIVMALCLLLAIGPQALAATTIAKDNWTSVRSKNFFLVGNASEKEIRGVAVRLEKFREVFSRLFPKLKFNSPVATTVIVFKSDSSYKPFKPIQSVSGYFQPGEDVNYITLTTEGRGEDAYRVIFHEYVHLLLNNTLGHGIPLWFNEGLAEYYSTFDASEGESQVLLGKVISNHVLYLRDQKMLPLRALFAVDYKSPHYNEGDKRGVFYAESWALVHYLLLGNKGQRQHQLGHFIDLLSAGASVENAFQQAFQTSFEAMEKELQNYIGRNTYPLLAATLDQKLETDAGMQNAAVSEAEAQAYLGDLLLHTNRLDDALTRLQQALAQDPDLAMAHASLGMLRVRQGRFAEARKSLERAVAADAQSYLVHYYYAFALSREGMGQSQMIMGYPDETALKMRAELKKAIALKPDFAESYRLLAFINLVRNEEIDESIKMLLDALALSPGKQEYSFVLAQLYMRKEDFKTARATLEPMIRNNADPDLRAHAQALLDSLKSREEQVARFKALEKDNLADGSSNAEPSSSHPLDEKAELNASLQRVLRKPGAGEEHLRALLLSIDCGPKDIVFNFKAGERTLNLHAPDFTHLSFISYTGEVAGEISCGARHPANHVVVTYRPARDPRTKTDGEIIAVEFVPKDFELEKQ